MNEANAAMEWNQWTGRQGGYSRRGKWEKKIQANQQLAKRWMSWIWWTGATLSSFLRNGKPFNCAAIVGRSATNQLSSLIHQHKAKKFAFVEEKKELVVAAPLLHFPSFIHSIWFHGVEWNQMVNEEKKFNVFNLRSWLVKLIDESN